jgi:hypothetical protein
MNNQIVKPGRRDWKLFLEKLNREVFSHYYPEFPETKDCEHTFCHTRSILESMPGVDVEETIDFFKSRKTKCDCTVLNYFSEYIPEF